MVDQSDQGSDRTEISSSENQTNDQEITTKTCVDCGTSKTPLWRVGPAGPKSLCNACGIRSRKRRRAILDPKQEKKSVVSGGKVGDDLKNRLITDLSREVSSLQIRLLKQRKVKLREEEEAAVLLMALSCGSVFCLEEEEGDSS